MNALLRSTRRSLLLAGALVVTVVAACSGAAASPTPSPEPTPGPADPAALNNRTFLSTKVTVGGVDKRLVDGTRILLSFTDGQMGFSAGCNHFGGTYTIENGALVGGNWAMTEMACDQPREEQDRWVSEVFGAKPVVSLDKDTLTITAGDTVITLLDKEVADPDQPLTGRTWTLESILVGLDAVSSVPAGVTVTIEFKADGTFAGEFGCNRGGGRYELGDGQIRFIDIVATKMACDAQKGEIEATVFSMMNEGALTYEIDANVLSIRGSANGLDFRSA